MCCESHGGTHHSTRQLKVSSWEGWKDRRDMDSLQKTPPQGAFLNTSEPISISTLSHHVKERWEVPDSEWPMPIHGGLIMSPITTMWRFATSVLSCRVGNIEPLGSCKENKNLHYKNFNELHLIDSRVLSQTMFFKGTCDNFQTTTAQITWRNVLAGNTIRALMGTGRLVFLKQVSYRATDSNNRCFLWRLNKTKQKAANSSFLRLLCFASSDLPIYKKKISLERNSCS